jgi:hypothetical protein
MPQVQKHVNAIAIARQQDKNKDKPYLLPLCGGQLYCHVVECQMFSAIPTHVDTLNVLAAKKRKAAKKVRTYLRHKNLEMLARFMI